jgi:cytochrome c biogenesis protein CcmG/thiol:disulfide interchange protein DsbE
MGPAALPGKADRPVRGSPAGETLRFEMRADPSEIDAGVAGRADREAATAGAVAPPLDTAAVGGLDVEPSPAAPRGRRRGIVVAGIVIAVAAGVMWAAMKVMGGVGLPQDPSGLRAPAFEMPLLGGGGSQSLAALRGKPVVLNFWASWCGPCKQEAPVLAAAERKWGPKGVVFLGVDSEDATEAALAFEARYGIGYDSVFDPQGRVELTYGVLGFPETFFIRPNGTIVTKYVGPLDEATLEAYVSSMVPAD